MSFSQRLQKFIALIQDKLDVDFVFVLIPLDLKPSMGNDVHNLPLFYELHSKYIG